MVYSPRDLVSRPGGASLPPLSVFRSAVSSLPATTIPAILTLLRNKVFYFLTVSCRKKEVATVADVALDAFPLKLQWLLRLSVWNDSYLERLHGRRGASFDPVQIFNKAIPPDSGIATVESVTPRLKDGAVFLKFSHSSDVSPSDIEARVREHLATKPHRPAWNPFDTTRCHLVRGRPWIEDLYRPPSCRLRIDFFPLSANQTPELSHEEIFGLLRPYGKLLEIYSQPADSKVLPKYANVEFGAKKSAILAKNCLHGLVVREENNGAPVVRLKLSYEKYSRASWAKDWLFDHPRIVIPLLAALLALIASVVFDPLRGWSVKLHVNQALSLGKYNVFAWATNVLRLSDRRYEHAGFESVVSDRRDNIEQIEKWLMETADTFIIVQGPRGSGKRELVVDQALKTRRNRLTIDCKKIEDARGDTATIDAMAQAVGYRPVFSWLNKLSAFADLAGQAAGVKTGFSDTLDGQMTKILNTSTSALRKLALEGRQKNDKDAHMADDDYLEAHPEKRPVVVLDNYLHKSFDGSAVYDKLADWAADLTTANVAHVVFLTTDASFSKSLSRALPNRVFRQLLLGDLPADAAKRFVVSHLDAEADDVDLKGEQGKALSPSKRRRDLSELDGCINSLGGRLTDLEFLARRIKAGETPTEAVREIVSQTASEIIKMFVSSGAEHRWSSEQAWSLISTLAASSGQIPYNQAVLLPELAGADADAVLASLEQAELIAIQSQHGRPSAIRPGRPVFMPAFQRLVGDTALKARLDLTLAANQIKTENAAISKNEDELRILGALPSRPAELAMRIKWLLSKIQASQTKVESLEKRSAELKLAMSTEL